MGLRVREKKLMGQLEKLQQTREQIRAMQFRQDNTVEQLLLEM